MLSFENFTGAYKPQELVDEWLDTIDRAGGDAEFLHVMLNTFTASEISSIIERIRSEQFGE